MTIEKRMSKRVALNISADVRRQGARVGDAEIENVNLDGMLLRVPHAKLQRGSMLDVAFRLQDHQREALLPPKRAVQVRPPYAVCGARRDCRRIEKGTGAAAVGSRRDDRPRKIYK